MQPIETLKMSEFKVGDIVNVGDTEEDLCQITEIKPSTSARRGIFMLAGTFGEFFLYDNVMQRVGRQATKKERGRFLAFKLDELGAKQAELREELLAVQREIQSYVALGQR